MPVESDGINLQMKLMGLLGMMPEVVSGSYVHVYTHTHTLNKIIARYGGASSNPNIWKAEADGSLSLSPAWDMYLVAGQPGVYKVMMMMMINQVTTKVC